jgi:Ca2+-binding EF-hand superfamily protein
MKTISSIVLISSIAVASAGCALNPFAKDNIYNSKNTDNAATNTKQPSAGDINSRFEKADSDKNGVISRQEADNVPGLAAIFERYNPDRDGTLDWNEFTAAMQSMNLSKN